MVSASPMTAAAATAALLVLSHLPFALADGIYSKSSPVLQVSGNTYQDLIAKSNHTSILEFYAPWCGHCQNLKPAYEKAAKSLTGLAKVAAVNCDDESNKPFCSSMGVQGFPTLKTVKPGKKPGKPIVEDYQGARTAKAITDAVVAKIPNHVKRVTDSDYQSWLESGDGRPKAVLVSDKGTTSALLKAVAIEFLDVLDVAQVRSESSSAKETVAELAVDKYPTLVLLPGDGKEPLHHDGEMTKEAMVKFLSQAADPNPDPAPKKSKSSSAKPDKSKAAKSSSSFAKSSASQASAQAQTDAASQTLETLEEQNVPPTPSPDPNVVTDETQKPIDLPDITPPIPSLLDSLSLQQNCLNTKAGTCIIALLPSEDGHTGNSQQALASLSEIHHKHVTAKRNLFPFYQLPESNPEAASLRSTLSLQTTGIEILAINGKRSWYRHYTPSTSSASPFGLRAVEDWIDAIRMGEGAKSTLPDGLLVPNEDLPEVEIKLDSGAGFDAMKESLKEQTPDGVEFELEEIDDDEYARILEEASKKAKEAEEEEHDEL